MTIYEYYSTHTHDGSMVLVYMRTWLGYIDGIHGASHIAYMDPMGYVPYPRCEPWCSNIYLHLSAIFGVNVGVQIPAPWSIWVYGTFTNIGQKKSPSFVGTYTTTMQHMGDDTIHFFHDIFKDMNEQSWSTTNYIKLYKSYHIFKIFAWDDNLTQHRNPRNPWPVHHRHDWALPSPTARTARQVGWLDVVGYSAPEKTYSHAEYISFFFLRGVHKIDIRLTDRSIVLWGCLQIHQNHLPR